MDDDIAFAARFTRAEWPAAPPPLTTPALRYTVVALGCDLEAAHRGCAVESWSRQASELALGVDFVEVSASEVGSIAARAQEWMSERVAREVVGWRLALCGDEAAVLALTAAAAAEHLLSTEVIAHSHSRSVVRLACSACGATTTAPSTEGGVRCDACGRTLVAREHVSRWSGRHLAVASPESSR